MRHVPLSLLMLGSAAAWAQEAKSGFDLRATLNTAAIYTHALTPSPRYGSPLIGTGRGILYPTLKLNSRWSFSGAVQIHTRPYFPEEYSTQGHGLKGNLLTANVTYSQYWNNGSIVVRAGQLMSAFGSFLLRYDPMDNPLVGAPPAYGYYYYPVSNLGMPGAQVDATFKKLDARVQFTNSSPSNPRSAFRHGQFGAWTGGVGVTIRQGFRIGVSAYRGPYLHRGRRFNFPGEADPHELPASGYGIDVQWARGPWNVYGELQRFQFAYRVIPTFSQHTGFGEVRRVLSPRWYVAARAAYQRMNLAPGRETYELAAGFRPNTHQLIKFDYMIQNGPTIRGSLGNVAAISIVTTFHPISISRD